MSMNPIVLRVVASMSIASALLALPARSALAVPLVGQGTWESTLQPRDVDLDGVADVYYDTQLDISWLAHAFEEGPPPGLPPGRPILFFSDAQEWAATLVVSGVTGWRLPKVESAPFSTGLSRTCAMSNFDGGSHGPCGYNSDTSLSELAHMYYETLGNLAPLDTAGMPQADSGLTNTGPFTNLRAENYWTGSTNDPTTYRWIFSMAHGWQNAADPFWPSARGAWAVHDGAVGVAMVPEPSSALLALLGLAGITLAGRRRRVAMCRSAS